MALQIGIISAKYLRRYLMPVKEYKGHIFSAVENYRLNCVIT